MHGLRLDRLMYPNLVKADWQLGGFSTLSIVYAILAFKYPESPLVYWLFGSILSGFFFFFMMFFTSNYLRNTEETMSDDVRAQASFKATICVFLVSLILLLFPFFFNLIWLKTYFPFEVIFAVSGSAIIGWSTYFDLRFLRNTVHPRELEIDRLKLEFDFWKTHLQQVMVFYGSLVLGILLGLDKVPSLMRENDGMGMVRFLFGILLLVSGLHFLISGRLYSRWAAVMMALRGQR